MKKDIYTLTEEEKAAGVTIGPATPELLEAIDVSDKNLEKMARGFILGTQSVGRRREIRATLEEKVTKKIGAKGKYLTDKLFELIEGVYIEDKRSGGKHGTIRYYKVPPNLQAIIYALDRVLGKPVARTEVNEEKKGVIVIESIIRNLAGDKPPILKEEASLVLSSKDLLKMQNSEVVI